MNIFACRTAVIIDGRKKKKKKKYFVGSIRAYIYTRVSNMLGCIETPIYLKKEEEAECNPS